MEPCMNSRESDAYARCVCVIVFLDLIFCQTIGINSLDTVLVTAQDNIYIASLRLKKIQPLYVSARVLI
jgi:hypothetical protein